jgi:hypothetical protein
MRTVATSSQLVFLPHDSPYSCPIPIHLTHDCCGELFQCMSDNITLLFKAFCSLPLLQMRLLAWGQNYNLSRLISCSSLSLAPAWVLTIHVHLLLLYPLPSSPSTPGFGSGFSFSVECSVLIYVPFIPSFEQLHSPDPP